MVLDNKCLSQHSFFIVQGKTGRKGIVGMGSAWIEVLMCANTLKAMGPFLGDGLSPLNYCV